AGFECDRNAGAFGATGAVVGVEEAIPAAFEAILTGIETGEREVALGVGGSGGRSAATDGLGFDFDFIERLRGDGVDDGAGDDAPGGRLILRKDKDRQEEDDHDGHKNIDAYRA